MAPVVEAAAEAVVAELVGCAVVVEQVGALDQGRQSPSELVNSQSMLLSVVFRRTTQRVAHGLSSAGRV